MIKFRWKVIDSEDIKEEINNDALINYYKNSLPSESSASFKIRFDFPPIL